MTFEDDLPNWRALARERLNDWKAERERRIKAEKERDEAKYGVKVAKHQRDNWESIARQALAEQSHPLTPDAITDEMVERAAHCLAMGQMPSTYSRNPNGTAGKFYDDAREVLCAAITEPPARPEGAEKVEAVLHQYWSGDINGDDLADRIAEEMNR